MKNYVLYHDDADGYASALAALLFFRDEAIYIPVQYNQEFPNQITLDNETNIYILDFSYSRDILDNIYSLVNKLVVIDHHDTAKDQFQDVVYFIFDNTKAGCILSWKYFHNDKKIPYIFDLVADRDLWKFYLSDTKAFDLGMRNTGKYSNIRFWETVFLDRVLLSDVINKGIVLEEDLNVRVNNIVKNPSKYKLIRTNWFNGNEYDIVVSNVNNDISEIGNSFNKVLDIDFSVTYFITNKGNVVLSLRGEKRTYLHLGEIAKTRGGGGHKFSAGISLSIEASLDFLKTIYSN